VSTISGEGQHAAPSRIKLAALLQKLGAVIRHALSSSTIAAASQKISWVIFIASQTYIWRVPVTGRAIEAAPPPFMELLRGIDQSYKIVGGRCLRVCKVLAPGLTKMFHVKHFGKIDAAGNESGLWVFAKVPRKAQGGGKK
jgi:hypothetical protein